MVDNQEQIDAIVEAVMQAVTESQKEFTANLIELISGDLNSKTKSMKKIINKTKTQKRLKAPKVSKKTLTPQQTAEKLFKK